MLLSSYSLPRCRYHCYVAEEKNAADDIVGASARAGVRASANLAGVASKVVLENLQCTLAAWIMARSIKLFHPNAGPSARAKVLSPLCFSWSDRNRSHQAKW